MVGTRPHLVERLRFRAQIRAYIDFIKEGVEEKEGGGWKLSESSGGSKRGMGVGWKTGARLEGGGGSPDKS